MRKPIEFTSVPHGYVFDVPTDGMADPTPIRDPLTGEPFANNTIPADRISEQAAALLLYYPLPNADPQASFTAAANVAAGVG